MHFRASQHLPPITHTSVSFILSFWYYLPWLCLSISFYFIIYNSLTLHCRTLSVEEVLLNDLRAGKITNISVCLQVKNIYFKRYSFQVNRKGIAKIMEMHFRRKIFTLASGIKPANRKFRNAGISFQSCHLLLVQQYSSPEHINRFYIFPGQWWAEIRALCFIPSARCTS